MCRGRISHPSYPRHSKYYGPWAVRIKNNNKKKKHIASRSNSGSHGVHPARQSHPITAFKTALGIRISTGIWVGRGPLFPAGCGKASVWKDSDCMGPEVRHEMWCAEQCHQPKMPSLRAEADMQLTPLGQTSVCSI